VNKLIWFFSVIPALFYNGAGIQWFHGVTPATESNGLWPWMNAPTFGRDVAPHGR